MQCHAIKIAQNCFMGKLIQHAHVGVWQTFSRKVLYQSPL